MIFGGWNTENLNTVYILKETAHGFQVNKSKLNMEQADTFPLNGVWGDDGEDLLVPGLEHIHRINEKALTVKLERWKTINS